MDLGGIIGGIGKALGGGGGLDLGKIAGEAMGALGGGGGGGGDLIGGLVKQFTGGGDAGKGGDLIGGLVKQFTGGGDAKGGAGMLGNIGDMIKGTPIEGMLKDSPLAGLLGGGGEGGAGGGGGPADMISSLMGGGGIGQMLKPGDAANAGKAPGVANKDLAKANADKAISQIDWSKDEVGLWVPGTGGHAVDPKFAQGLGPNASTVAVDYQADLNMPDGVATGMETTRLILDEAEKRGKKVNLGGHSQGAWVAGEVMADPTMRDKVNKAVLFGHPTQANAQYDGNKDPKVREINNADDPYTQPTIDLGQIIPFLIGQGDPNIGRKHAYDFASQADWLKS